MSESNKPRGRQGVEAPAKRATKADIAAERRRAREELARAEERRRRNRRRTMIGSAAGVVVLAVVGVTLGLTLSGGSGSASGSGSTATEVVPPPVAAGAPDVQPPALVVANTTGIPGVVAYDTTGWPSTSSNGPAAQALGHNHVDGPVTYSVTPPVGGDHNSEWANCGVYDQPLPNERAVHDLEHGAVWITYAPTLPHAEVLALRSFVAGQSTFGGSGLHYIDLSPYPGLPSPIVVSSWGFQLALSSPTDPRLQRFVDKFRASSTYTPEAGGPCSGGVGTPLAT